MNKCEYCGRENEAEALYCSGCGTPLVSEELLPPRKKSKIAAGILAFIFGPLGLLYLGGEGFMVIIFLLGLGIFVAPILYYVLIATKIGLLFNLLARVVCVMWAVNAVERRNANPDDPPDTLTLLNEAAQLENTDIAQAIAKYEEVISMYPESRASAEAARNIQTLNKAKKQP
jgi:hypothetical protein